MRTLLRMVAAVVAAATMVAVTDGTALGGRSAARDDPFADEERAQRDARRAEQRDRQERLDAEAERVRERDSMRLNLDDDDEIRVDEHGFGLGED